MDPVPDRDTTEYVEWLLKKATPDSDAPMVVQWEPHVKDLLGLVKELRAELEHYKEDYDLALETIRKLRNK